MVLGCLSRFLFQCFSVDLCRFIHGGRRFAQESRLLTGEKKVL